MIVTKKTIEQLSKELSLPYTGIEQDWAVEMADANRVDEFIEFYKCNSLSIQKKVGVVSIILASYEDFLNNTDLNCDERWDDIKQILNSDRPNFNLLLDYWSLRNTPNNTDFFRLSRLIKTLN